MFHRIGRKLGQAEVAPLNGLCTAFGQRSVVTRLAPWAGWLGIALALAVLLSTVFGTMAQAYSLPAAEMQAATATLKWNEIFGYTYTVEVRRFDKANIFDDTNFEQIYAGSVWSHEINLDDVFAGSGDALLDNQGLADHAQGYEFRVTASDGTMSNSSTVIIIDSPILKAMGNSTGSGNTAGEVTLEWTSVRDVLNDDSAYDNTKGKYTFRVRRLGNSQAGHHHTKLEWKPDNYIDIKMPNASVDGDDKITGLKHEEIHAIQLIFTVDVTKDSVTKEVKVFAARDTYVWPSNRPAGNGERVATFPLNYPLRDLTGMVTRTFRYHVCEKTFGGATDTTADGRDLRTVWKNMIIHALSQWELATDGWITMSFVSPSCADYDMTIEDIKSKVEELSVLNQPITTDAIRDYVTGLDYYANFIGQDLRQNDVIMVDDMRLNNIGAFFPEIARELGFAKCVVELDGAPPFTPACASYRETDFDAIIGPGNIRYRTTDILLRKSENQRDPAVPEVRFNSCRTHFSRTYENLVHEAGHALGIRSGSDGMEQLKHHPTIPDTVMSYESDLMLPNDPDCTPHPFDIMAIFAIYQTY